MKKTYYAVSGTGVALLGKSFVLKDRLNLLPDVPMTELGLGNYEADLPAGTSWNIYEGATSTGIAMDVLLAETKEPIVASGNSAHVYFGNKTWRALAKSDVVGLVADITYLANTDVTLLQRIIALEGQVGTPSVPTPRTFKFNGKTYSADPITVLQQCGILETSGDKNYWQLGPSSGGTPFTVVVPADGSWVDAFRLAIGTEYDEYLPTKNFTPPGLLHNLEVVNVIQSANKAYLPYLDFRYSILESPIGTVDGIAPFVQVGNSTIAKQLAYTYPGVGGADGYVAHSVRDIGAALTLCGGSIKLKVELRLKVPASAITMTFTAAKPSHVSGQLYPEVL